MEASALQAPAALARSRLSIGSPLLRLRSDEQLVALFRGGNEEAFRVIHDRYQQRLFAYTRQMLPGSRQDAEDAVQDIFVRAYSGLRASGRQVALRAWLYRVAHNRCVDELRRPPPPTGEIMEILRPPNHDPIAVAERRESLRRLIEDVRRLPDQQRSALLMRELGGVPYADLAVALGVSVPAVKSLLVRARIGLAHSMEARDAACNDIRAELVGAHDRGVRPSGIARRHMHDCSGCREFRGQIRGTSRSFAALMPLAPLALIGKVFGIGGGAAGGGAAGGGAAGSGAAAAGGMAGTTGAVATISAVATGAATHVATIIAAAAVVTAGGAVEIQHSVNLPVSSHHAGHQVASSPSAAGGASVTGSPPTATAGGSGARAAASSASAPSAPRAASQPSEGPALPAADQVNPADASAAGTTGSGAPGAATTGTGDGTTSTGSTGTGTVPGSAGTGVGTPGAGTTGTGTGAGGSTPTGAGAPATGITGPGAGTPGTGTTGTGSNPSTAGAGNGTTDGTGGTPGTGGGSSTPIAFGPIQGGAGGTTAAGPGRS